MRRLQDHRPPELRFAARFLQDALGGEVKSGRLFARGVDPVDEGLPMLVLIVA